MKAYLRIYRWSMQMKLHMALYAFVTIFLKAVCSLLQGVNSLPIMDIATMWLVSLVFAMIKSAIYPENSSCTKGRTLAWAIVANLCFIGGAWMFGWFAELPLWGKIILVVFLEMGLAMMWFGDQFVLKMDSAQLTKELKQYQKKI